MDNPTAKKIGRRAAGSWGRPGSKWMKRQAWKAVRRIKEETTMTKFIVSYKTPIGRIRTIEVYAVHHEQARYTAVESLKIDFDSITKVEYG